MNPDQDGNSDTDTASPSRTVLDVPTRPMASLVWSMRRNFGTRRRGDASDEAAAEGSMIGVEGAMGAPIATELGGAVDTGRKGRSFG